MPKDKTAIEVKEDDQLIASTFAFEPGSVGRTASRHGHLSAFATLIRSRYIAECFSLLFSRNAFCYCDANVASKSKLLNAKPCLNFIGSPWRLNSYLQPAILPSTVRLLVTDSICHRRPRGFPSRDYYAMMSCTRFSRALWHATARIRPRVFSTTSSYNTDGKTTFMPLAQDDQPQFSIQTDVMSTSTPVSKSAASAPPSLRSQAISWPKPQKRSLAYGEPSNTAKDVKRRLDHGSEHPASIFRYLARRDEITIDALSLLLKRLQHKLSSLSRRSRRKEILREPIAMHVLRAIWAQDGAPLPGTLTTSNPSSACTR